MSFDDPIVRILTATAMSTAVLGYGLRGKLEPPRKGVLAANLQRRTRWLFVFTGILCSLMTFYVAQVSAAITVRGPNATTTAAALVLFGLIGGIVLMRVGLRGRWVGDHPYCTRCGFDLFGKPAESTVCNECGADLHQAQAIVIGVRRRRLFPALAGAFFLTLSIAFAISLGRNGFGMVAQFSFAPYKPTSWLVRELDRGTIDQAGGYELYLRMMRGKLDTATIEHIATLPAGAQPSQWSLSIARLAWTKGELSEATMRLQIRARLAIKAAIDETASPKRIGFTVSSPRLSVFFTQDPAWSLVVADRRCEVNGVVLPASAVRASPQTFASRQGLMSTDEKQIGNAIRPLSPLALGPAHVKLAETLIGTLAEPGRPVLTESVDLTLLDADTTISDSLPVPSRPDFSSDALLQETTACTVRLDQQPDNTTKVDLSLATTDQQTRLASTAYLRSGATDTFIGPLFLFRGKASVSAIVPGPAPAGVVEIVLKPTNTFEPGFVPPPRTSTDIVFHAPLIERAHTR